MAEVAKSAYLEPNFSIWLSGIKLFVGGSQLFPFMSSPLFRTLVLLSLALVTSILVSEFLIPSRATKVRMASFKATYPNSLQRDDLTSVRDFHGKQLTDKFAWLEDPTSEDVKKWVDQQNEVTESYLTQLDFKTKMQARYAHSHLQMSMDGFY